MAATELEAAAKQGVAYFMQAVEYARTRNVVLPQDYYGKLTGTERSRAVTIAGLAQLEQIKFVIDQLNATLSEGGTFADFKKRVRSGVVPVALPDYRLDNIYRTNIQAAYAHGKWQQQSRSTTRPYLMYDAINDSRTRPAHAAMDNIVLPREHSFWRTHYPPNGYRCRCTVISLTVAQATARGITEQPPPEPQTRPDKGWDYHVGQAYTSKDKQLLNDAVVQAEILTKAASAQISAAAQRVTQQLEEAVITEQQALATGLVTLFDESAIFEKRLHALPEDSPLRRLSVHQLRVIYAYTGSDFAVINQMLRNPARWQNDPVARHVLRALLTISRNLEIVAAALPPQPRTTWRGVSISRLRSFVGSSFADEFVAAHTTPGAVVECRAFTSTSKDQKIANGMAGSTAQTTERLMLEIEGDTTQGVDVTALSNAPKEQEVLLLPGAQYKIVSSENRDGTWYVKVRLLRKLQQADYTFAALGGAQAAGFGFAADSSDALADKILAQLAAAADPTCVERWSKVLNLQFNT